MAPRCVVRCSADLASALADVKTSRGRIRLFGVCEVGPLRKSLVDRGLSPERASALAKGFAKKRAVAQVRLQARALTKDAPARAALERPGDRDDAPLRRAPPSIAQELAAEPVEADATAGVVPLAVLAGAMLPAPWPWNWIAAGQADAGTSALLRSFLPGPTVRRGLFEYRP